MSNDLSELMTTATSVSSYTIALGVELLAMQRMGVDDVKIAEVQSRLIAAQQRYVAVLLELLKITMPEAERSMAAPWN